MSNPILTAAIDTVANRVDLTTEEATAVLSEIMRGDASEAEIAAFLIGLRTKGESVGELVGLAMAMRSFATKVEGAGDDLLDTAGTGGGYPTFNVSTTAALIAAGAGCRVAKHGNRSATSRSGSADVLEALGARIDLDPDAVAQCIADTGFGFMFAPRHHAATRFVIPVRKELAVRTIFNFLGPLTNPAGACFQVIGVSDPGYVETIAAASARLGVRRALVVSSADGLDEMSISASTHVVEVTEQGALERREVHPGDAGLTVAPAERVPAGTPEENAATTRAVLAGEPGAARDIAVLNAAAAIYVAGRAGSLAEGARAAEQAIDGGAAASALEAFVARTRELAA